MAKKRQGATRGFEPDPMLPLIRKARQQIEESPGSALGWLLDFLRRSEPAQWLPGEVEAHGYRLLALVYGPLPESLLSFLDGHVPPVTPADVESIHAEMRAFFRDLVTLPAGTPIKIPTDDLHQVLVRATAPSEKPAVFVIGSAGGPRRTILFQTVRELILKHGDRLIACPRCKEPFLALRKRLFCSSKCLQAWYDAKRPKKGAS